MTSKRSSPESGRRTEYQVDNATIVQQAEGML